MGFLDRLLGRGKEAAESAGDTAKDLGEAKEEFEEAKDRIAGDETPETPQPSEGSEVSQAEQRLDDVRDQAARDEGRMP
jgi:hypothetical protein